MYKPHDKFSHKLRRIKYLLPANGLDIMAPLLAINLYPVRKTAWQVSATTRLLSMKMCLTKSSRFFRRLNTVRWKYRFTMERLCRWSAGKKSDFHREKTPDSSLST